MALLEQPLFWTTLTIAAFWFGQQVFRWSGEPVFLPPILTAIVLVIATLELTGTSYATYMTGGDVLHQMLAPMIVMLAVPMYQQIRLLKQRWGKMLLAVVGGSGSTLLVSWLLVEWLIQDRQLSSTILAKSITTPVAVAVSEQAGRDPALAAAFVIVTGFLGAVLILPLMQWLRMTQPGQTGMALGVCAHAIGTSRALEIGKEEAAYAAAAMTLTASLHALVLPWLMR